MDNRIALLGLALGALANAAGSNVALYQAIVNDAFEAFDRNYKEEWSWTETSTEEDGIYVGRYDPRRGPCERWVFSFVPLTVDVEIRGSAMLFIRFDEKESLRFHAYEYAAP